MTQSPSFLIPYQPSASEPPAIGSKITSIDDSTGGLIAYYLAIFSLLPIIGLFLGMPAFVLGILGLRDRRRNPAIKVGTHAWIGIILGHLMALIRGGLFLVVLVAELIG